MNDKEYLLLKKFLTTLEKHSFAEVEDFLKSLPSNQARDFLANKVYNTELLSMITNHKILLVTALTQAAKVFAEPEDRTRIVFLLAKHSQSTFQAVNHAFELEFGPLFKIFKEYAINGKNRSWRELAIKAGEIRNALRNYDLLNSVPVVDEIMNFYKMYEVNDQDKLTTIIDQVNNILPKTGRDPMLLTNNPDIEEAKEKITTLYKSIGRLDIDIKALDSGIDFDQINELLFLLKYSSLTKLLLIDKKTKVTDLVEARNVLLKYFASQFSLNYRGDELKRQHVKLQPVSQGVL